MSSTITVAAPPTTAEAASDVLSWIGGQSGVQTDFNPGSQVRTDAEAVGSVCEMQGVIAQAMAFQAMVYAAWAALNIFPFAAVASAGTVTFTTGSSANPPAAPSPILIPSGTILSSVGGIQFQTITSVTIPTGSTTVNASVQAVVAGAAGNVAAGAITQISSALSYPLQVTNGAATTGGADAETPAQTMARFTATVAALGLSTPVAIANGVIGVEVSGTSEEVEFSTVYEPWIEQVAAGNQPTPGYVVFVDNGSGSASSNLLAAVTTKMNGNQATGDDGLRPAGVPYGVSGVVPIYYSVSVSGTAINAADDASLTALTIAAVEQYAGTLAFGDPAEMSFLLPAITNQIAGSVNALNVQLLNVSGVVVSSIQPLGYQRMVLQNLIVNFN